MLSCLLLVLSRLQITKTDFQRKDAKAQRKPRLLPLRLRVFASSLLILNDSLRMRAEVKI